MAQSNPPVWLNCNRSWYDSLETVRLFRPPALARQVAYLNVGVQHDPLLTLSDAKNEHPFPRIRIRQKIAMLLENCVNIRWLSMLFHGTSTLTDLVHVHLATELHWPSLQYASLCLALEIDSGLNTSHDPNAAAAFNRLIAPVTSPRLRELQITAYSEEIQLPSSLRRLLLRGRRAQPLHPAASELEQLVLDWGEGPMGSPLQGVFGQQQANPRNLRSLTLNQTLNSLRDMSWLLEFVRLPMLRIIGLTIQHSNRSDDNDSETKLKRFLASTTPRVHTLHIRVLLPFVTGYWVPVAVTNALVAGELRGLRSVKVFFERRRTIRALPSTGSDPQHFKRTDPSGLTEACARRRIHFKVVQGTSTR